VSAGNGEPTGGVTAEVVARPRRIRLLACIAAPLIVVVFTVIATTLHGRLNAEGGTFETGDQAAMIGLGVLAALGALVFTRPRVIAGPQGIQVRNLLGSYELSWQVVRAVRFNRGSSWVTLDLEDDDVLSVLAVQAADKEYAVDVVRRLRALHAAARAGVDRPAGAPSATD
jgi:hypothetical protein